MQIRSGNNNANLGNKHLRVELVQIALEYKEIMAQTIGLLKDSYYLLGWKRDHEYISSTDYERRLKNHVNMALIYIYSLYEGFTTKFFMSIELATSSISKKEFKERYPRFHDIVDKLMKEKYNIYLPSDIFKVVKLLREARNSIAHGEKEALPDIGIIELCSTTVGKYFNYLVHRF